MLVAGVDTGGTFTDFILFDGKTVRSHKVLSRPEDPAAAVLAGMKEMGASRSELVHGTTVGTNAFLERKGARVAFITNKGMEDLLDLGRQVRGSLYDLNWRRPPSLVPRTNCYGVSGRLGPDGREERKPGPAPRVKGDVAAICLLHSYANPSHERALARKLRIPAVLSSSLVPEYREYERATTTVINAYLLPVMRDYLSRLGRVRILASNGGSMTAREAAERPVHTILSGPAGGAVAVRALGLEKAISFDMGGTSTDVAVIRGEPRITKEGTIGGYPIRIPTIEIHTVGAGGGSLARVDAGGALRVGPESAGAMPGPACYGRGGGATVTDANVVLGRIDPARFFGGRMRLDREAARRAIGRIAGKLDCPVRRAAEGILSVANANMERAIRMITVERGIDPSDYLLVAFGGAGPLHACALAEALRMKGVVVPPFAGLFSAVGMVFADRVEEKWRTVLADQAEAGPGRLFDIRYKGQSYEIRCGSEAEFHRLHRERYGFDRKSHPIEVVNVGVRKVTRARKPKLKGPTALTGSDSTVYVPGGWTVRRRADGSLRLSREGA